MRKFAWEKMFLQFCRRKCPQNAWTKVCFLSPIKLKTIGIKKAICALGASINVMPMSLYLSLKVGPLKETM